MAAATLLATLVKVAVTNTTKMLTLQGGNAWKPLIMSAMLADRPDTCEQHKQTNSRIIKGLIVQNIQLLAQESIAIHYIIPFDQGYINKQYITTKMITLPRRKLSESLIKSAMLDDRPSHL